MINVQLVAMLVCVVILSCSVACWMVVDIRERNRIERERKRIENELGRNMFHVE